LNSRATYECFPPSTDRLVHEIMKSVSVRPTEPYPTRPVKTIFPVCRRCVSSQKPVGIYLFARTVMRRTLRGKAGRRLTGHSRMVPSCLEQAYSEDEDYFINKGREFFLLVFRWQAPVVRNLRGDSIRAGLNTALLIAPEGRRSSTARTARIKLLFPFASA
jgi:hypothetical protein